MIMETLFIQDRQPAFLLNELKKITADILENYPNIQIAGVTSFPCYLYDEKKGDIEPTYNLLTVKEAVDILKEVGVEVKLSIHHLQHVLELYRRWWSLVEIAENLGMD